MMKMVKGLRAETIASAARALLPKFLRAEGPVLIGDDKPTAGCPSCAREVGTFRLP
jgi:hypothetical protein